jgi:hypothetical protein
MAVGKPVKYLGSFAFYTSVGTVVSVRYGFGSLFILHGHLPWEILELNSTMTDELYLMSATDDTLELSSTTEETISISSLFI